MCDDEHYLKRELYELIRKDASIFEFLQAGSLDGIWYWDLEDTDHEWMSPRLWEVFGYDPATKDHLASEWQDMIFPEDLELALENLAKHSEDPSHPYDQIVRYRHKDGHTVWVRCRGLIVRDESGKPARMLGAHTDITEPKIAEEAATAVAARLKSANAALEDFRAVMDASAIATVVWKIEEKAMPPRITLALVNRRAGEIFSGAVKERIGKSIESVDDTLRDSGFKEQILEVHKSGDQLTTEFVRSGSRSSEVTYWTVNMFKVRTGLVAMTLTDVSPLRQAHEEIRRSNSELEQFAYAASHDLQEPLRMVANFTQLLQEDYADRLDDEGRRYLEYAHDGARRMHQLINDVLRISRIDAQLGPLSAIELGPLAMGVVDRLRVTGALGTAVVHIEPLGTALVDEPLMQQVFENLISNGIKFNNSDPPEIWIRSRAIGRRLEITVADNGIGIEARYQNQIFDMFQRLHSRSAYPGTGIGLAIVAKIVARHQGELGVDSAIGRGSQFRFTLITP